MENDEYTAESANDGGDNLETIKGIGPKISDALNKIGINRYIDLAGYTPDELSSLLEQAGRQIPSERIAKNNWIGQAIELAERENVRGETSLQEEAGSISNKSPLTQQAGFSLFFDTITNAQGEEIWQTRVYHEESGDESIIQGFDPVNWLNWILERTNLPLEKKIYREKAAAEGAISVETDITPSSIADVQKEIQVDIMDVNLSERGPSAEKPEKQLMAEVRFHLAGTKAEALTEQGVPFRIEIYLIDDKGGSTLASSGRSELRSRVYEYVNQRSFPLPEIGDYELYTIVLFLPPHEGITYRRGPTFEVVA